MGTTTSRARGWGPGPRRVHSSSTRRVHSPERDLTQLEHPKGAKVTPDGDPEMVEIGVFDLGIDQIDRWDLGSSISDS